MRKTLTIFIVTLVSLNSTVLIAAASPFSAICTLKSQHHYHLANSLDKKSKMINEWTEYDDRSTSLTVSYSGGKYLDIIDDRTTKPLQAPIIFDNGNTIYAINLAKGASNGEFGATTRTYAVNFEAQSIVSTTIKSGNFMSATVEASADGNPECVFKLK